MKKILFLITLMIAAATAHLCAASLSVENLTIQAGQNGQLAVSMTNTESNLSGFQFRLYLPEGLSIATNDKGKFQYTFGDRIANHSLTIRALDDGGYQFIAYSMDGDVITGTSGVLLSVPVVPEENFVSGNGTISDIRLTDLDANKTTCSNVSFTITKQAIPATGITLSQSALSFIAVNQTATLTATVTPANATNKNVRWTSSNTNVATVSNTGVVTSIADGTATITATTADGTNLSVTCAVTVAIPIPATGINFVDANVKTLCVANWDTNGDGELDEDEAAAVTSLGKVFKDNSSITSFDELQYFTGLTTIGEWTFYGCSSLTSVTIPNNVTSIGNYAFGGCTSLPVIDNIRYADTYLLGAVDRTQSTYIIKEGTKFIGLHAFMSCSNLTSITIPNSVTSIGAQAFDYCSNLTSITIPESVTSIDINAFDDCPNLTSISVASGNTKYDSRDNCNAIIETATNTLVTGCKNTVIPNNVTSIGDWGFCGCSSLTSITIPESVTSIGVQAFSECSGLTSITIPNSVTNIGVRAFEDCSGLTSVTCLAKEVPSMGAEVFTNVPQSTVTLYVPAGSVDAYKAAAQWKSFGTIAAYTIPATSVALNKTEATIEVGAQEQLTATVLPEGATDKTVTWTSSDPTIATVDDNGLVTAVGNGTATITAATNDGTSLEASCAVTVMTQHIYIETDLTNQFPIDWEGWNGATGYVGWAAPQVTTNDGRQTPACERFDGSKATTGVIFNRTLTGLTNGTYRIELYGAAASTKSRDTAIDTDMTEADEGDETAVYLYATTASGTVKQNIPVHWALNFNTSGIATATLNDVVVTDGTVEIGMYGEKKFTNWEVVQIKGVTALVDAEELHANTLTRAQSALDDEAYVNVTGQERAALSQAIADNTTVTEQTAAAYQAAITALDGATKTFTEAKAGYDGLVAAKTLVEGRSYLYATEAKKSAAEGAAAAVATNAADAVSKKDALMTAYRQYAESSALMESIEGAVDVTSIFIRNPKAEEAIDANVWQTVLGEGSGGSIIIRSNEPWIDGNGDTNHRYFDGGNWDASAWDVTFRQKITLPAGRYQLSAMGRSSQDVTLTLFARETTAEMAHIGAAGGLFDRGWEQTSVEFELTEQTTLSIGVRGVTNVLHNWMSFSDFRLVQSEGYAAYIALNKTGTAIAAGEQEQLTATVLPAEAGQNVVWQSSNPEVATVDETGLVTAVGNGIATITATATNGSTELSASCSVRVAPVVISGMCGENVYYILDEDYNLTIFGTGNMYAYGYNSQPWKNYKNQINNVVIEDGVTGIGNYAFYFCSGLTSVTIGNSVASIGEYAFSGCSGLTSVTIGNSVTSIGEYTFGNCSGLTSVTIPNSVTSIGYNAFHNCSGLTSVTIGSSVTSIGNGAFQSCSGLTSITIPNSVTSIGNYAFRDCSGLTSVTIGNGVTGIGFYAFAGCSGLTSVTCFAEEVPTTGSSAFYEVPQGTATLYVPAGSVDAYKAAEQWKEFGTITALIDFADANVKAICVANWDTNGDGELSETEAAAVTSLGEVFKDNTTITSFDELQYFTGLTTIGKNAFSGCSGLTSITIPNSVTSIGSSAFYGCSGLISVTIPNSVTSIGVNAFSRCSGLTSVTIPESVTSIDSNAFFGCTSLPVVDNIRYADTYLIGAVDDAQTSYSIREGTRFIGSSAFDECPHFTSITIPESVTNIGSDAFSGCSGLTSVTIPNSVTYIGNYTFSGCSSLTSIIVEAGNTKYDSRNNCNAIIETSSNMLISGCKNTIIPNSVTSIGGSAFYGCSGLTSITIPESVTSIGSSAFWTCSGLTSVTIGNSVTSIGNYAFGYCSALTSVTCLAEEVPSMGSDVFANVPQNTATLYVPSGSVDAYKAAEQWNAFGTIAAYAIPATSVALNKAETTLEVGAQEQLTATVLPEDAVQAVTWTSSDPTVATVDGNGLVTAVASGTATITATTTDGTRLTASCKVTVEDPAIPGDVNGDGTVNGADIVAVINYVLADDIAGDVNGDGNVNGADIVAVINYVLNYPGGDARETLAQSRAAAAEEPAEILSGTKTEEGISLSLTGGEDCTAFQFMLSLPEGVSLTAVIGSEERLGDHELLFRRQEDGRYLVLGFAMDNHCIGKSSGELLSLQLEGNANGRATINEALIFTPQAETRYMNALDIDLPTAVSGVRAKGAAQEGDIYDLGGRKLNKKPSSGYYIQGGKMYFAK